MKSVEIKRIEGRSVFKATLYIGCISAAIFIFVGIIMFLASVAFRQKLVIFSSFYMIFTGIIYSVAAGLINGLCHLYITLLPSILAV
jgi:hypothetical protein